MSKSGKQAAAEEAVHELANHVYAKRSPPSDPSEPLDRAAENPDSVLDRLETAMQHIWAFAEDEGLAGVLEDENAPRPTEVRDRYEDRLIDYRYDDTGEFDDYAFDQIWNEVADYYRVLEDLVDTRDHGF